MLPVFSLKEREHLYKSSRSFITPLVSTTRFWRKVLYKVSLLVSCN